MLGWFSWILFTIRQWEKVRARYEKYVYEDSWYENMHIECQKRMTQIFDEESLEDIFDLAPSGYMDWVVSIAGGGLRNLYTAGVIEALRDLGVKFKASSGTSSGSWCAYSAIRPSADGSKKLCCSGKAVNDECGHPFGILIYGDEIVNLHLTDIVCSGGCPSENEITVAYCHFEWWKYMQDISSSFYDEDDFISACQASSAIPFVSAKYGFKKHRGHWCLDGAVFKNNPKSFMKNNHPNVPVIEINNIKGGIETTIILSNERQEKLYRKGYEDALTIVRRYYEDLKDWGNHGRIHIDAGYAILKYNKPKISWKRRKHKFVVDPEEINENMDIDDDFESSFESESNKSSYSSEGSSSWSSLASSDAFSELPYLADEVLTTLTGSYDN